ncbi:MAG: hotdog fold thioesterase [Chitinivibrionales bacterium]|nr:hotdog fold thioesterase [Chitinivibrionales bacterium]
MNLKKFFARDRFAASAGIELVDTSDGYARAVMPVQRSHLNGVNSVQGGAIFTLADLAFAAACNSHGTVAVAINVSISFVKAATGGTLTAEAREVAVNPKLSSVTVNVTDESGDLVAIFQGMAYRKKVTLEEVVAGDNQSA